MRNVLSETVAEVNSSRVAIDVAIDARLLIARRQEHMLNKFFATWSSLAVWSLLQA
jgi:hypothetical protein